MSIITTGTVMELSGIVLPNYAARGLTFVAQPIDSGSLDFDANGTLHDLTMSMFRKLQFTISCTDVSVPVLQDVWKGKLVSVTVVPGTGLAYEDSEEELQQTFDCMLVSWQTSVDEAGARTGWTMTLLQR